MASTLKMFDNGRPGSLGPVVRFCLDRTFYFAGLGVPCGWAGWEARSPANRFPRFATVSWLSPSVADSET